MDAAEARIASLKSRLLCPGVRGAAYQHLYACSPQGVLHPSDVAAACTGDSCMDDDRAALEASVCVGGGSKRERDTKLGLKLTCKLLESFSECRPTFRSNLLFCQNQFSAGEDESKKSEEKRKNL